MILSEKHLHVMFCPRGQTLIVDISLISTRFFVFKAVNRIDLSYMSLKWFFFYRQNRKE